jgi:hypothetical protein
MTRYCKEDFEGEIGRGYRPTSDILRVMPMAVEMNLEVSTLAPFFVFSRPSYPKSFLLNMLKNLQHAT